MKTLEKLLGLKSDQLHSIVVFMGESKFKTKMPENVVWGGGACARYIKSKTARVLNARDVSEIIAQIESGRLAQGKQTDQLHIHHVRTGDRVMPPDLPVAVENACPKCASPMILRTARKGAYVGDQFWGCSRYPGCRGTRKCTSGGVEG